MANETAVFEILSFLARKPTESLTSDAIPDYPQMRRAAIITDTMKVRGIPQGTTSGTLTALINRGYVEKPERMRYRLTQAGLDYILQAQAAKKHADETQLRHLFNLAYSAWIANIAGGWLASPPRSAAEMPEWRLDAAKIYAKANEINPTQLRGIVSRGHVMGFIKLHVDAHRDVRFNFDAPRTWAILSSILWLERDTLSQYVDDVFPEVYPGARNALVRRRAEQALACPEFDRIYGERLRAELPPLEDAAPVVPKVGSEALTTEEMST
jgi:hypothetical protein